MSNLPLATFEKILKASRQGIRVSDKATKEFIEAIDSIAKEIASEASTLAEHANRKTIMDSDVKLAVRKFMDQK